MHESTGNWIKHRLNSVYKLIWKNKCVLRGQKWDFMAQTNVCYWGRSLNIQRNKIVAEHYSGTLLDLIKHCCTIEGACTMVESFRHSGATDSIATSQLQGS